LTKRKTLVQKERGRLFSFPPSLHFPSLPFFFFFWGYAATNPLLAKKKKLGVKNVPKK
jgi:hypothetical protein